MKFFLLIVSVLLSCLGSSIHAFTVSRTAAASGMPSIMTPAPTTPTVMTRNTAVTLSSTTALFGKKAARAQGNESKKKKERPIRKAKDDVIEVDAVVTESLPNAMFRCAIDDAPESQAPVLATISGKIRKNFVKILVGDKVLIELSPYDLTRGRITFRHR